MRLITRAEAQGLHVNVAEPRLDAASALAFKRALRHAMKGSSGPVVLDLSQVTVIDSSGLGALIAIARQLAPHRALHLSGLSPPVARVFHLTRMDSVFTILESSSAAGRQ